MSSLPLQLALIATASWSVWTGSSVSRADPAVDDLPAAHLASTAEAGAETDVRTPGERRLRRSPDGLFYVDALVNGTSVRFVVDTGATVMVLTRADAARAGVTPRTSDRVSRLHTAGGTTAMRWSRVEQVEVAGRKLGATEAALPEGELRSSLLGHSVLSRLGSLTLSGDELTIR